MKYNTISSSSLVSESKKSTLTIYADLDVSQNKMAYTEAQMASIRGELEIVQNALKLQTKRCRQLVAEYTRRLQEKEQQYNTEKALRDDQLAKVLRALLIFEARLKQEQKFISHQLSEKDYIIKKQNNDIQKLLANQYCKSCNQFYTTASSPIQESLDSSSEYVVTDYQDYQSSNFESLDSSSETYATLSEKNYNKKSDSPTFLVIEEPVKSETESNKKLFEKHRSKDSLGKKSRKQIQHRPSIGTYFEVLKLRNDSPCSNEDNTSNDYDNLDSLPTESITDKISIVSDNIEAMLNHHEDASSISPNDSNSECNNTIINKIDHVDEDTTLQNTSSQSLETKNNILNETIEQQNNKDNLTESIPVFECDGETMNDNWYASASDQEDEEQRDIYRNNPVLECMNQILLQNINDPLNSPPKTPNIERKSNKNKRVKFSDEEDTVLVHQPENPLTKENLISKSHDYYETPIQKTPNFYETPQSIYSNDYEQILSKCSKTFSSSGSVDEKPFKKPILLTEAINHYYVDMEPKVEHEEKDNLIIRKSKILRTPPALPPKPANLVSKYKIQNVSSKSDNEDTKSTSSELEPDYCSISELNLPQNKNVSFKKINVVAEINAPTSNDVKSKLEKAATFNKKPENDDYDSVIVNDNIPNLVVKKCVEKLNIQIAKQTSIKSEPSPKKIMNDQEIPKLPQVSEILIPDEVEEEKQKEERITQDNYVKNNSQIFKLKSANNENSRRPIVIGSSVSSLITGFNNQQLLSEIKKKPERSKVDKLKFTSFENLQNLDKPKEKSGSPQKNLETPNFENFDLSQNFEEFKLDDCEIEEYNVDNMSEENNKSEENRMIGSPTPSTKSSNSSSRVDIIRATNDLFVPNLNKNSIDLLKKQLQLQKNQIPSEQVIKENYRSSEPTYEHFLECTGLSSKSILTPSRLLSNHKSMLKPKDVKLRSKTKAHHVIDRYSTPSVKYWSEPYI